MNVTDRVTIPSQVMARTVGDETVILDLAGGTYYGLDAVGARMTGEEYLDFFGKVYGLDAKTRKSRSDYLLDYFGLNEAARRRSGEYSKGMKQKLAWRTCCSY